MVEISRTSSLLGVINHGLFQPTYNHIWGAPSCRYLFFSDCQVPAAERRRILEAQRRNVESHGSQVSLETHGPWWIWEFYGVLWSLWSLWSFMEFYGVLVRWRRLMKLYDVWTTLKIFHWSWCLPVFVVHPKDVDDPSSRTFVRDLKLNTIQ